MTPKRGQPPKPPDKQRTQKTLLSHTEAEKEILKKAHRLSGSTRTLSRWLAELTMEEAERIIASHKKK